MAVHASHAALPYPIKGARYTVDVIYLDADGDPTDPVTPDTEISKDNGNFADCTEDVAVPATNRGGGMMTFTGDEMNCSTAKAWFGVASGPKVTMMILQPRVLPVIFAGTAQAGGASSITLATDVPAVLNLLRGCIVVTTGGTGGGGGSGSRDNQARIITAFSSGLIALVSPNFEVAVDGTTNYKILAPFDGGQADQGLAFKYLQAFVKNKITVDRITGDVKVYDDDGTTVLYTRRPAEIDANTQGMIPQ